MYRSHLLPLVWLLILASCSSGKKAYQRGDYYDAVMKSIGRLRQNPDHRKSGDALRSSYPQAVAWYDQQAKNQIASDATFKYRDALGYYNRINEMYEAIQQAPGALRVIPNPVSYYDKIAEVKEKAAEESYEAGINELMKGDRQNAKQAYFHFSDAQKLVPGYKDAVEYMDKSMNVATLFIVVEQMPVPARYNLSGGFFQDKVEEFLHNNYTPTDFLRFYSTTEAETSRLERVDQILRIQFDDFSVGNTSVKEREQTVTRDSVKIGETTSNGKTVPVYGTVKATLSTIRKEVTSSGVVSMVVVDAHSDGVLAHRKFPGTYVWGNSWGHFNGDERALTSDQLAMCKRRDVSPPDAQDLFYEFTRPIYDQLVSSLKGFYAGY